MMPREPFVVHVFERRLAVFDQPEVGGHELEHAPPRAVAAHQPVEIILEGADLVARPFLGQGAEGRATSRCGNSRASLRRAGARY